MVPYGSSLVSCRCVRIFCGRHRMPLPRQDYVHNQIIRSASVRLSSRQSWYTDSSVPSGFTGGNNFIKQPMCMVWCRMVVPLRTTGMFVCYVPTIPPWVFMLQLASVLLRLALPLVCATTEAPSFVRSLFRRHPYYGGTLPYHTRPDHTTTKPTLHPFPFSILQ